VHPTLIYDSFAIYSSLFILISYANFIIRNLFLYWKWLKQGSKCLRDFLILKVFIRQQLVLALIDIYNLYSLLIYKKFILIFALYNLASVRMHIYDILRSFFGFFLEDWPISFPLLPLMSYKHLDSRFEKIIRWHKCTVRFYRAVRISSRDALYARHSLWRRAERVMSTWKNLCPGRLESKVTSGIMGARGFNGPPLVRGVLFILWVALRSYIAAVRYAIPGWWL